MLSKDTGYARPYGENPYVGYDAAGDQPFLYDGVVDGRLAPKERVVTVDHGGEAIAFPYTELAKAGMARATVGGEPVVVRESTGARLVRTRAWIRAPAAWRPGAAGPAWWPVSSRG